MRDFVLSSESVTIGHPDKLCDQISDAIVDAYLSGDEPGPVVAECALATGIVFLSVRAAHAPPTDLPGLARRVIEASDPRAARDDHQITVMLDTTFAAPPDDSGSANEMTTAFGYASQATPCLMPYPIWAAHRLTHALDRTRHREGFEWLPADAQIQVAVRHEARRPVHLDCIAVASGALAHAPGMSEVLDVLRKEVVEPAFGQARLAPDDATRVLFRQGPTAGGLKRHSGLTGRKTADDTYGSFVRHSASAMSGKDPGRLDRTAAYAARLAARSVVVAGLATECEVQISYVMGDRDAAGLEIDTFGSGTVADTVISRRVRELMDLRPGAIAERLDLWGQPKRRAGVFYRHLASYGQIGRDDIGAPWEDAAQHLDLS